MPIVTIYNKRPFLKRIKHYLFECPTFWELKPRFKCPVCGKKYRCYWDGNDIGGKIDVCCKCAHKLEESGRKYRLDDKD